MRAISLWQPWGSAMMTTPPLKTFETRDWMPSPDPPFDVVIHAAKQWKKAEQGFYIKMRSVHPELPTEVPLGKLLGVVTITGFHLSGHVVKEISAQERTWGNYEEGRWAWKTENPRPFRVPVPWKGSQGFFNVPDHVIQEALQS